MNPKMYPVNLREAARVARLRNQPPAQPVAVDDVATAVHDPDIETAGKPGLLRRAIKLLKGLRP